MVDIDLGQQPAPATRTRRSRKLQRTREQLYRAALRLFRKKGFDATTVQEITEAADAGKGTFFHHFPTKDHVLVEHFDAFNRRLLDAFDRIEETTAAGRLLAAMEVSGKAAREESELGRVLLGRVFVSPALLESDQANETRLMAWMEGVVQGGIERGELRPDTDVESFLHLVVANMSNTVRDYVMSGEGDPVELLVRRTRLLLRAVSAHDSDEKEVRS